MEPAEYERMAAVEDRHWWYRSTHDLVLRFARAEAARLRRPLAMLDAGCGTGRLAQLLQPLGEVTGCDIHEPALAIAARRGLTHLRQCDLAHGALDAGAFDLITTIDVLYHRRVGDGLVVLRRLHGALRPGGLLLLQVPAFPCLRGAHDIAVHTRHRYRRAEVARLLRESGFTASRITCRLLPLFLPMLAWRLASRRHASPTSDTARLPASSLHCLLHALVCWENRLLVAGARFPLGTSIFAHARRPAHSQ